MESQLRHRLETQVAEAESLRQELVASRDRSELAEAAARAAEQRTRDGADEKTSALLGEMETLMEEKLAAEAQAGGMKAELGELRESLASAEQRAAQEQSMVIQAAQERIARIEEVHDFVPCFLCFLSDSFGVVSLFVLHEENTKSGCHRVRPTGVIPR